MFIGVARFDSKVVPEPNSGCWLWSGVVRRDGYSYYGSGSSQVFAHRFAYEAVHGHIPKGMQIDHLCRTRCCVNPAHLEVVTPSENACRGANCNRGKTFIFPYGWVVVDTIGNTK